VAAHPPIKWKELPKQSGESLLAWLRRFLGFFLIHRAGSPFELLAERRHALVGAEARRTKRKRLAATGVCAGVPLVAFVACALLSSANSGSGYSRLDTVVGQVVGLFVSFWPLVCYLGAALTSAGAVMEEIEQETALQLVLTPIPARPLAAAKILPRVRPYLWGVVALLPLYVWAGATTPMAIGPRGDIAVPSPLIFWPLRMATIFYEDWDLTHPLMGCLVSGPLMCLFDATLVWTAALWGAVFAVGSRGLLRTAARLALHVFLTSLVVCLCLLGGLVAAMLPASCASVFSQGQDPAPLIIGAILGVALGLLVFGFLWWRVILCRPAEEVLTAFQAFDRLANEEFNVGLPRWVEGAVKRGAMGAGLKPPIARVVPPDRRGH